MPLSPAARQAWGEWPGRRLLKRFLRVALPLPVLLLAPGASTWNAARRAIGAAKSISDHESQPLRSRGRRERREERGEEGVGEGARRHVRMTSGIGAAKTSDQRLQLTPVEAGGNGNGGRGST